MGRHVDYSKLDIDQITSEDFEGDGGFEKIGKKKRFDDGTVPTKTGRKKQKVQRGGKDDLPDDDYDE
jgi:hypothetical protein